VSAEDPRPLDLDGLATSLRTMSDVKLLRYGSGLMAEFLHLFEREATCYDRDMLCLKAGMWSGEALRRNLEEGRPLASRRPTAEPSSSVDVLDLSVRGRKCLERLGIATIGQLTAKSEWELLSVNGCGETTLGEIKDRLAEHGLGLSPNTRVDPTCGPRRPEEPGK
jgi:hypothetical protein